MSRESPSDFTIRRFSADDFAAVRDLYRVVWREERDPRYDRMRMLETVRGVCIAVVAFAGDQCVGFYMVWPVPLSDGAKVVNGAQAIDTMTHPEFQGRGLLTRMACACYQLCADNDVKVLFGAPNRAAYPGNLGRLNWSHTGDLRLFARPLTLAGAVPGGAVASLALHALPLKLPKGADVRLEAPQAADLDACLAAMPFPPRTWRTARTADWYAYRYQPAGKLDYTWTSVYQNGALISFSVVGIPTQSRGRFKLATLAEVVGRDRDARRAAVGAAIRFARRTPMHALITQSTSRLLADALRANGFVAVRKTPLITRVLGPDCFEANPFVADAWELFGGDFDIL